MIVEIVGIDGSGKSTIIDKMRKIINKSWKNKIAYERNFKSTDRIVLERIELNFNKSIFSEYEYELIKSLERVKQSQYEVLDIKESTHQIFFTDKYLHFWLAEFFVKGINHIGIEEIYKQVKVADLIIFLKIPPERALERLKNRDKGDRILNFRNPKRFLSSLQEGIERNLEYSNDLFVIDASQEPDIIVNKILKEVRNYDLRRQNE